MPNNTLERTGGHRGPRLAAAQTSWPAAQLNRYTALRRHRRLDATYPYGYIMPCSRSSKPKSLPSGFQAFVMQRARRESLRASSRLAWETWATQRVWATAFVKCVST